MPEWCENELMVSGPEAEVNRFLAAAKSERAILDFERIVPPPAEYPAAAGKPKSSEDWCDWRVDHWGTKWNTDIPALEELDPDEECLDAERAVLLVFGTAWTPPVPVVVAASAQFPGLAFRLAYWQPFCDLHGVVEADGGEVVEQDEATFLGHRKTRNP